MGCDVLIQTKALEKYSPLAKYPWGDSRIKNPPISLEEIAEAISSQSYSDQSYSKFIEGKSWNIKNDWTRKEHIARIAYLVVFPDDENPLDLVVRDHDGFPIIDGNHRIAAALYRGNEFISVISSDEPLTSKEIEELLASQNPG
jgi:hypothetical protein